MELPNLDNLERQVNRLMERLFTMKKERDEQARRIDQLESELSEASRANEDLQTQLTEARCNARDPEKEQRIRAKVDELLAKLEGL